MIHNLCVLHSQYLYTFLNNLFGTSSIFIIDFHKVSMICLIPCPSPIVQLGNLTANFIYLLLQGVDSLLIWIYISIAALFHIFFIEFIFFFNFILFSISIEHILHFFNFCMEQLFLFVEQIENLHVFLLYLLYFLFYFFDFLLPIPLFPIYLLIQFYDLSHNLLPL